MSNKEQPKRRVKEIQGLVDKLAVKLGGRTQEEAANQGFCVTCASPIRGFRDELSKKEYRISGMCQACQDSVFGK